MTDCKNCGHEYKDHRAYDLKCPRIRPYIAGVVNVGDWESETYYHEGARMTNTPEAHPVLGADGSRDSRRELE